MRKIVLIVCSLIVLVSNIDAQDFFEDTRDTVSHKNKLWNERIFFGGNLGLLFGSVTYIELAPLVGYKITNALSAGGGITYIYYRERLNGNAMLETSQYGWRTFVMYDILRNIDEYVSIGFDKVFLYGEYGELNVELYDAYTLEKFSRVWVGTGLLGLGLSQSIGNRSSVDLLILWDVTQSKYSSYSNPVIRLGFTF